jgi:hypothetical protein
MANAIPAGQDTGQALGDLLGGVNRPQLNAFVANSQARNGLLSAQTQDALIKASQAQEQMAAHDRIKDELVASGAPDSEAALLRDFLVGSNNNDPVTALKALGQAKLAYGNPNSQTAGQQMFEGKLAPPVATPNNYQAPPGSALANAPVQQSPQGVAQTADTESQTALRNAQAAAGGFNPHTGAAAGGAPDPQAVDFGAYMLYKTGKMPALGMGGGQARMAIISRAAQLAQQESQQPGSTTNPGYDAALANGQDFTAGQRTLSGFAGGPLGNQVRSINNVTGHLQLMENLFGALQNGDVQGLNKLGAAWKKAFGTEAPTDIQTAASFIGPELTKILSANGSTGTAEERQEFANTAANLGNSPEQTTGAITTLKNMLGRQLTDMALQYHGATGRSDFARRYVAPDVAQYLEVNPGGSAPASPGAAPAPTSTNPNVSASPAGGNAGALPPQALVKLQEGMHTTFGNGQVWTLQNGKPVRVQ